MTASRRPDRVCAAFLLVVWTMFAAAVYVPDVGRGFVKDDFRWVDAGRTALAHPVNTFLRPRADFYRPLVELTFAADYAAHGLSPRGYGFTNLALYAACIAALAILGRAVGLSDAAAALAAFAWAANPHGINMAVVWLSGRTSLCGTLCALLAAIAVVRRRYLWTSVCFAAALASKEEALLLPVALAALHAWVPADRARDESRHAPALRLLLALGIPLVAYAVLRVHSGAMTPASAPPAYQLTLAPRVVLRNAFEYFDRTWTIAAVAVTLAAAVLWRRPALDRRRAPVVAAALVWCACSYGITLFVPVRSSLYAVLPSVGAAIACGAVLDTLISRSAASWFPLARLAVAFSALLLAMVPSYRARNARYVEPARLSARALRTIAPQVLAAPVSAATVVLYDVDDPLSNFSGAFGGFAPAAVRMYTGRTIDVRIRASASGNDGLFPADAGAVTFGIDRGRVFRVGP